MNFNYGKLYRQRGLYVSSWFKVRRKKRHLVYKIKQAFFFSQGKLNSQNFQLPGVNVYSLNWVLLRESWQLSPRLATSLTQTGLVLKVEFMLTNCQLLEVKSETLWVAILTRKSQVLDDETKCNNLLRQTETTIVG